VFLAHGLKHYRKRSGTMKWVEGMGFSNPSLQWFFMSFAEIGVGLSLVFGLLTSVGVAGLVSLMTVAFWTVHRHAGFWVTARPDEGWEYVFVLSAAAVALALFGPGKWSVDHALGTAEALDAWVGLALAGVGVVAAAVQLTVFYRRTN
jgi:putative oxidoreductase